MPRQLEPDDRYCCGAPWNEEDYVDPETGEEITICGCLRCRKARQRAQYDEARADDDRYYNG
jgi:hypothetical protein